jgi:hypothetical protein
LAAISFAASIILGLSSVDLPSEFIPQLLVVDIAVGLIAFMMLTVIKEFVHSFILLMDEAYFIASGQLNVLKSYFVRETYSVDKIEDDRIGFFWEYNYFASLAVRAILILNLEHMLASKLFTNRMFARSLTFNLPNVLEGQKRKVKIAMDYYENMKSSWHQYSRDLKDLNPSLYFFFEYHGYKVDKETGEMTKSN